MVISLLKTLDLRASISSMTSQQLVMVSAVLPIKIALLSETQDKILSKKVKVVSRS